MLRPQPPALSPCVKAHVFEFIQVSGMGRVQPYAGRFLDDFVGHGPDVNR